MIRSELLAELHKDNPELRAEEIEQVVEIFFDEIAKRLAEGGRVELRGFGAFSTREREARTGRNPRTGEAVSVPAKKVPYFKAGKEIRERLNEGYVHRACPRTIHQSGEFERRFFVVGQAALRQAALCAEACENGFDDSFGPARRADIHRHHAQRVELFDVLSAGNRQDPVQIGQAFLHQRRYLTRVADLAGGHDQHFAFLHAQRIPAARVSGVGLQHFVPIGQCGFILCNIGFNG